MGAIKRGEWRKQWFLRLSPKIKCAWFFLNDVADDNGKWKINEDALTFFIGEKVTSKEILEALPNKVGRDGDFLVLAPVKVGGILRDLESESLEIYNRYPRKMGRRAGTMTLKRHFREGLAFATAILALERFLNYHKAKGTKDEYIPYFSTWVNNLDDWLDQRAGEVEGFGLDVVKLLERVDSGA